MMAIILLTLNQNYSIFPMIQQMTQIFRNKVGTQKGTTAAKALDLMSAERQAKSLFREGKSGYGDTFQNGF
jgi:hypothetical protein